MFNPGSKLMGFMEWVTKLLYIQMIWILFCLIGLVIGGVFPATFTMFAMFRKLIIKQEDFPVFKTFMKTYKNTFINSNILGYGMALLGFSIYYYIQLSNSISIVLVVILSMFGLVYLMTILFIIPVYVHFDISLPQVIKHAGIIALSHPLHILLMVLSFIGFWYLMLLIPSALPFIGLSLISYVLMFIANLAFTSIERKVAQ